MSENFTQKQEFCIINRGNTTKYFIFEKGTRQVDTISAYLLILVLERALLSIKENKNIKGLNIFNDTFLYTAYADNTAFLSHAITCPFSEYFQILYILA